MAKVKVYRVGKLEIGKHNEELTEFWGLMDAAKPASHPTGRSNAIYVSPNTHGLLRWFRGNVFSTKVMEIHEVIIDSDDVYCYDVDAYENVPSYDFYAPHRSVRFKERTKKFWDSGVTLTEWLATHEAKDGADAEILLDPSKIISSKRLSHGMFMNRVKDILNEDEYSLDEVKRAKRLFA